MRKSRLSRKTEKQNKNTIILSIIGIVIVLFLLVKFGIGILVGFSVFLSGRNNQTDISNDPGQINFVASPILNPLPIATNSAEIVISGKSLKDYMVMVYVNSRKVDEVNADKDGNFDFTQNLQNGENNIKAKAQYKDKQSEFSDVYNVLYKSSKPNLEISTPSDGQQFKKDPNTASVTGKTESGVTVTVNGFWAVVDDGNNFSYNLPLQNGDNEIKVVATDLAGNQTEKTIKVNYSQ